jgi:hypothetical protein
MLFGLSLILAGLASAPRAEAQEGELAQTQVKTKKYNPRLIDSTEIAQLTTAWDAHDIIRLLRPNFLLNGEEFRMFGRAPLVAINGSLTASNRGLHEIKKDEVVRMRLYDVREAYMRFAVPPCRVSLTDGYSGGSCDRPVLDVTVRPPETASN